MSLFAIHLANGLTSNGSVLRLMGRLLSGSGVVESTGFTVSAQGTPDMTLKVSGSTLSDNLVVVGTAGDTYHGWNTANANVTITANATGVTKKDHIVAYFDTALTSAVADNPGGLVLIAVRGTGTASPTDTEINTATSSKPWLRLAEITVANGAGSINSGNIADLRTRINLAQPVSTLSTSAIKLGYVDVTASQTPITAEADLTGLSVTVTVPAGGRDVEITAKVAVSGTATSPSYLAIKEGSTYLGSAQGFIANTTNPFTISDTARIAAPSAGSHTYKLALQVATGTGTMYADSAFKAFILVKLI